jgi:hypothetical protein
MDELDEIKLYVEMWKQTVDVQQHFNDIELRIRGLALTVLTFSLGGAAIAIEKKSVVTLFDAHIHLAAIVLFAGVALWGAFYFVDQIWYHRLLIGAVIHGTNLESEIAKKLPAAGLTKQITTSSAYPLRVKIFGRVIVNRDIRSASKMRFFYGLVAILLVVFAIGAQIGS